jgi:hypothetical protein
MTGGVENAVPPRTYLSQLILSLKNTSTTILLALQAHRTPTSLDGAGLHGLDVDSSNFNSAYFAHLCIPASETTLHQKKMSIADRFHLRRL